MMNSTWTTATPSKPSPPQINTPQSLLSVSQLIQLAEQAYDSFSPGIAAKYYEDAIQHQPKDASLYHKLGTMYVEHGEPSLAHDAFLKSIQLSPNSNESNYLYIGQQCYGHSAISAFEKGIELMKTKITALDNEKEIDALKSEISSVYVSIAELFMTDLCDEEDAQIQCEKYLHLSLQFDINNIETYATLSQFKHCQQNDIDAIKYFNLSFKKLFSFTDDKLDIFGEQSLSIDSFLKIVKLGIELEQYQVSLIVLKALINANDALGECWALGALCFYKLDKKKDAAIWLNNAESILSVESASALNLDLKETLEAIQSEMNRDDLPDLSKLNLDETVDDDDEKNDEINAFLEDDDDDADDEGEDDVDLEEDVAIMDQDDDIDLDNYVMVDID